MQSKGLDSLLPIWAMIYSDEVNNSLRRHSLNRSLGRDQPFGLNLSESDVSVTYTRYINNYKNTTKDAQKNTQTIDDAVKSGLTPGKKA